MEDQSNFYIKLIRARYKNKKSIEKIKQAYAKRYRNIQNFNIPDYTYKSQVILFNLFLKDISNLEAYKNNFKINKKENKKNEFNNDLSISQLNFTPQKCINDDNYDEEYRNNTITYKSSSFCII